MKKFMTMAAVAFTAILAGCAPQKEFQIALITDVGDIDDKSFNQGSWEGVVEFAEENNKTYQYYKPTEVNSDEYIQSIELAVEGGAEIIVTPGFLFEVPIFFAQDEFPNINFILLDGVPHNADYSEFRIEDNVMSILYAEEQAGFLAGYAAVMEGYTKLGFMGGMAVPAVVRFGIGFAQGAQEAAELLQLTEELTLRYHYTGDFAATLKNRATADTMFQQGVEVIFAAGGAVGASVMAAAEQANKKVIGVDINQGGDSPTVITSAMKGLTSSVYQALEEYYNGEFRGGEVVIFNAANNGIGLPTDEESFLFETFTIEQYDAIFEDLANDVVVVNSDLTLGQKEAVNDGNFDTLLDLVNLIWID